MKPERPDLSEAWFEPAKAGIEHAKRRRVLSREKACRRAAVWIDETAWLLPDEVFEDCLLRRDGLTEDDCAQMREFRAELIEDRGMCDAA